jgi:acetyltransferase-like isoleucine patch superfamily enzyme
MSYFDEEYEYLPWNTLSEKEEEEQKSWQGELEEKYNIKFGKGSVISKKAHIYEVESAIFGEKTQIASHALLRRLKIECGDNCSFNSYCVVHGKVKMGSFVRIAPGAKIFGENHGFSDLDTPICRQQNTSEGIVIGDDVWIGANAVITDGVNIGSHSIVAAGAVVTRSFPEYSVLGSSPARVIKNRLAERKNDEAFQKMISNFGEDITSRYKKILSSYFDGKAYAEKSGERRRAVCDAVEIAAFFSSDVPHVTKEKLVDEIKSFQRDECDYESVLSASYALEILGEKPIFFSFADEEWSWDDFDNLKWKTDAWDAGHITDIYATAKYFNKKYYGKKVPEKLFTWLSSHISPKDGLWGEGETLLRVNGYYRAERGSYSQFDIPVPYAERTIDSILSHAEKIGVPKNACNALDIVHPLFIALKNTNYRRSEAEAWCVKMLPEFLGMIKDDGFPFAEGEEASLKGTEMWLSIIYTMCSLLNKEKLLGYSPKGVHR